MRFIALILALLVSSASAQVPMTGAGKGAPGGGAPAYTGVGDIVAQQYWYGLRAYSSATRGNAAINLCDNAGANCADVATNASTGVLNAPGTRNSIACSVAINSGTYVTATGATSLVIASTLSLTSGTPISIGALTGTGTFINLTGYQTTTTGTIGTTVNFTGPTGLGVVTITGGTLSICLIGKFYDQTGGGAVATQTTAGNMAILGINGGPSAGAVTASFGGGQSYSATVTALTPQPLSGSAVVERTGNFAAFAAWIDFAANGAGDTGMLFDSGANTVTIYAGSVPPPVTAADNAFHAMQALFNTTTSSIFLDGSSTTGLSVGTQTGDTGVTIGNGVGGPLTGNLNEVGGAQGDQSSHFSALNTNQHTFWGF